MSHKKTMLSLLFWVGLTFTGYAQESINTSGGEASGTGGSSSYSFGQMVDQEYNSENGSLSNGVQQAYEISEVLGSFQSPFQLELAVYPNPTSNILNLKFEEYTNQSLSYFLYDVQGMLLENTQINSNQTIIQLETYSSSAFILKVVDKDEVLKVFKIIKN